MNSFKQGIQFAVCIACLMISNEMSALHSKAFQQTVAAVYMYVQQRVALEDRAHSPTPIPYKVMVFGILHQNVLSNFKHGVMPIVECKWTKRTAITC